MLDVFLQAMKHEMPFRLSEEEQLTWLRHIARNRIIDCYRQRGRVPAYSSLDNVAELLFADEEDGPEAQLLRSALSDELLVLLADLSPVQQAVLQLRFAKDLSTREIARRLNKSDGAIRTLLSRTLNHLRRTYELHKGGGKV